MRASRIKKKERENLMEKSRKKRRKANEKVEKD